MNKFIKASVGGIVITSVMATSIVLSVKTGVKQEGKFLKSAQTHAATETDILKYRKMFAGEADHHAKTYLNGNVINSYTSDGNGGWILVGGGGKINRINKSGDKIRDWSVNIPQTSHNILFVYPDGDERFFIGQGRPKLDQITIHDNSLSVLISGQLLNGKQITAITSDGKGGFFIGGAAGEFDHIDSFGNLIPGWTTKTLLGPRDDSTSEIDVIFPDGNGGFFVGGTKGKLDHIDADGNLIAGWTTKTYLGGNDIKKMISDSKGNTIIVGSRGTITCIDSTGAIVPSWSASQSATPLLGGNDINDIISDGETGFYICGANGKVDHIDSTGNVVPGWTTKTLLNGGSINGIVSDGEDGYLIFGDGGLLQHLNRDMEFYYQSLQVSFDDLVSETRIPGNGESLMAKIGTDLPEGIESVSFNANNSKVSLTVNEGAKETVSIYISYKSGYTGAANISKFEGPMVKMDPKFIDLIDADSDTKIGETQFSVKKVLPEGIKSVTLSTDKVSFGNKLEVYGYVQYESGFSGPARVSRISHVLSKKKKDIFKYIGISSAVVALLSFITMMYSRHKRKGVKNG